MEELKIVIDFLSRLFTPQQQTAILIMSLCVLVATHNFKIIWFGFHAERRKARKDATIRLFAVVTGSLFGVIGHYVTDVKEPMWFWLVSGLLSSGGAFLIIAIYKRWLEIKNKLKNNE